MAKVEAGLDDLYQQILSTLDNSAPNLQLMADLPPNSTSQRTSRPSMERSGTEGSEGEKFMDIYDSYTEPDLLPTGGSSVPIATNQGVLVVAILSITHRIVKSSLRWSPSDPLQASNALNSILSSWVAPTTIRHYGGASASTFATNILATTPTSPSGYVVNFSALGIILWTARMYN